MTGKEQNAKRRARLRRLRHYAEHLSSAEYWRSLGSLKGDRLIPLYGKYGEGKFVFVPASKYGPLSKHRWYMTKKGYVERTIWRNGKPEKILMHRLIAGTPDGLVTDHRFHNKSDNSFMSLRVVDKSGNAANRIKQEGSDSRYKGVVRFKPKKYKNSFRAQIVTRGKIYTSGQLREERWAAFFYNIAARVVFGENAHLNEIPGTVSAHY